MNEISFGELFHFWHFVEQELIMLLKCDRSTKEQTADVLRKSLNVKTFQ